MSISVSAKNARIWRKDFEGRNGVFHKYSTNASKKNEDGSFTKAYIDVYFAKQAGAPKKIENGAVCDFTGFMSVDSYTDKDGNKRNIPIIVIMSAEFEGDNEEGFAEAEEDIPF